MSQFRMLGLSRLLVSKYQFSSCRCILPKHRPLNSRGVHNRKSSWPPTKWFYIPASVGFGVIFIVQLKHMWRRRDGYAHQHDIWKPWVVDILKLFPTRSLSRLWGSLCNLYVPELLRKPLFNSYSYFFKCNLDEAIISDVTKFNTFNKFFIRKLKPDARYVDPTATLVSPADATVVSFGTMSYSNLHLDQIKGLTYPLDVFVGPRHPFMKGLHAAFSDTKKLDTYSCGTYAYGSAKSEDYKIFYVSVYLAPGDYHWFHSPTEWTVEHRRHIPGHLFSVDPRFLRRINGIFNFNERVILSGHWQHGLFMYAAIGAYNVGSICLNSKMEKDFITNCSIWNDTPFKDRLYGVGELSKRGDSLGGFELGSSLVLVFTAPKDFEFSITAGQKLKYGEKIGNVGDGDVEKIDTTEQSI